MHLVSWCDHGGPVSHLFQSWLGNRAWISGAAGLEGDCQVMRKPYQIILPILLVCFVPAVARAQSFRVQCPTSTITHPVADANHPSMPVDNNSEPAYTGP